MVTLRKTDIHPRRVELLQGVGGEREVRARWVMKWMCGVVRGRMRGVAQVEFFRNFNTCRVV